MTSFLEKLKLVVLTSKKFENILVSAGPFVLPFVGYFRDIVLKLHDIVWIPHGKIADPYVFRIITSLKKSEQNFVSDISQSKCNLCCLNIVN